MGIAEDDPCFEGSTLCPETVAAERKALWDRLRAEITADVGYVACSSMLFNALYDYLAPEARFTDAELTKEGLVALMFAGVPVIKRPSLPSDAFCLLDKARWPLRVWKP